MSFSRTARNAIDAIWKTLRTIQNEVRRLRRDVTDVQRIQNKNVNLLPGVEEFGPMVNTHHLVLLKITAFVGGTPTLWNAKRQMLGASGLEDDDEDTVDYVVEQALGANGVYEGSYGFAVLDRVEDGPPAAAIYKMVSAETITFMGRTICTPPGLNDLTNEDYYLSLEGILAGVPGGDSQPIVLDGTTALTVTATNLKEISTHTHGVRTDTFHEVTVTTDNVGKPRFYFSASVALMVTVLGGAFGAYGMTGVDDQALLRHDSWDKEFAPKHQRNNAGPPDFQNIGPVQDRVWFKGTWFIVGNFTLESETGGGAQGYGFARYDWDLQKWIGVLFKSGESASNGTALGIWDRGIGKRLYVCQNTNTSPVGPKVKEIDYDPDTKAVTVTDIGWNATMGANATVECMVAYDDGAGEKFHFVGTFITGPFYHHVHWDGSTFGNYANTPQQGGNWINWASVHDFEDGVGPRITFSGSRNPVGGPATSPVWSWNHKLSQMQDVGTGFDFTFTNERVVTESFNHRLLAGVTGGAGLYAIDNGIQTDWRPCTSFLKDVDGLGLWFYFFDGQSNVRKRAAVNALRRYGNRLAVGGEQNFIELRRGRIRSGPIVYHDTTTDAWHRVLPLVQGNAYAIIPFNGGALICGDIRGSFPGGVTVLGIGVWHDPGVPGGIGTWENIGDVEGTVYAAVKFGGNLHIFGAITSAGGVACQGHAWRDTSGVWHKGLTITGTPKAAVVVGSRIIIAGLISKVNGQAQYKVAFGYDGTSLSTIFDDIDAPDGQPFVNALHLVGGTLFMAGWFDWIDQTGSPVTARCIAQMDVATEVWDNLKDWAVNPVEGITNNRVAWSLGSAGGLLYVGTDADAIVGDFVPTRGLATWDINDPIWATAPTGLAEVNGPTRTIHSDTAGDKVLCHINGTLEQGGDGLSGQNKVIELAPLAFLGGSAGENSFESDVLAIWKGDAGGGVRTFAGGGFASVGAAVTGPASRVAGKCFFINKDDRVEDMAGGLGITAFQHQFISAQAVFNMRVMRIPNPDPTVHQKTIAATGHAWMDESAPDTAKPGTPMTLGRPVAGKGARPLLSFPSSGISGDCVSAKITLKGGTGANFADACKALRLRVGYDAANVTLNDREPETPWLGPGASDTSADVVDKYKASFSMPTADGTDVEIDVTDMYQEFLDEMANGGSPTFGVVLRDDDESTASVNVWEILAGSTLAVSYIPSPCGLYLSLVGLFAYMRDGNSLYFVGIDINGKLISARGGLSGSLTLDQPGAFNGVNAVAVIPESRWPAAWSNIITACQPHVGFVYLLFGSFNHAINDEIGDADLGTVLEDANVLGVAMLNGRHLYPVTAAAPPAYVQAGEVFNGEIITGGGLKGPRKYTGDHTSGSWSQLVADGVNGGIYGPNHFMSKMLEHDGVLMQCGKLPLYPNINDDYALIEWDGASNTPIEPPGFVKNTGSPDIGDCRGRCLIRSRLFGGVEQVYMGGVANTDECPVVVRSPSGTWSAVGGSSQLRGDCRTLTPIEGAGGELLLATGELWVNEGAGWGLVKSAVFDGTSWTVAGYFGGQDETIATAGIGDNRGHGDCELGPLGIRGLVGGRLSEVSSDPGDIGTPNSTQCFGIVQYRKSPTEWEQMPGGGVDGHVFSMASAQEVLWPT